MLALRLPLRLAARVAAPQARVARPQLAATATLLLESRSYATPGRPQKPDSELKRPRRSNNVAKQAAKSPANKTQKPAKVLTPEEKAAKLQRKKERMAKIELKSLKQQALSPPSSRPATAWALYIKENLENVKTGDVPVTTQTKRLSEKYKDISSYEKERLLSLAREDDVNKKRNFQEWLQSHTPTQIYHANLARKKLRFRLSNSSKYRDIVDDRLVKRPQTPYIIFHGERLASGAYSGMSMGQAAKEIAAEFKALSESEKKKYENMWEKDLERYMKEYVEVYGEEPAYKRSLKKDAKEAV